MRVGNQIKRVERCWCSAMLDCSSRVSVPGRVRFASAQRHVHAIAASRSESMSCKLRGNPKRRSTPQRQTPPSFRIRATSTLAADVSIRATGDLLDESLPSTASSKSKMTIRNSQQLLGAADARHAQINVPAPSRFQISINKALRHPWHNRQASCDVHCFRARIPAF